MNSFNNKFQVINSNNLELMAYCTAKIIKQEPLDDPMDKEHICVMNLGMKTYLSQKISLFNDIESNIQYDQIWQLIWYIHKCINPQALDKNLYDHKHLLWNILSLKDIWNDKNKEPLLGRMQEYVLDDENGIRAYELAARLADTYDQYQMYRPEWIIAWDSFSDDDFTLYSKDPQSDNAIGKWIKSLCTSYQRYDHTLNSILHNNIWQIRLWCLLRKNFTYVDDGTLKIVNNEYIIERKEVDAFVKQLCSYDRSELLFKLKQDLVNEKLKLVNIPKRVFIFGISALPIQVMEFLHALGYRTDVYLMLLNPCAEYWGDLISNNQADFQNFKKLVKKINTLNSIDFKGQKNYQSQQIEYKLDQYDYTGARTEGNELLLSLGKQGRDNLSLLLNLEPVPDFSNYFIYSSNDSVLKFIQNSMLSLEKRDKYLVKDEDDSIEIHSCHTILREVQVLKDAILRKFAKAHENNQKLLPRDIVVMVPSINTYAPYINAVFAQDDGGVKIPFGISDRTVQEQSSIAEAILSLLSISSVQINNSYVINLLSNNAIGRKFNISQDDVLTLCTWINESNIHWGLDFSDIKEDSELDLPYSFTKGIERMLLGSMLAYDNENSTYNQIEGSDGILLGNFVHFIRQLYNLRLIFTPNLQNDPILWVKYLNTYIINAFFYMDDDNLLEVQNILNIIQEAQDISYDLINKPKITLPVFCAMLKSAISSQREFSMFYKDRVNFCSLVPMRAVPFEHIFVLGLNDIDFPRQENAPGFNLMTIPALAKRADRSRAHDDRFLFLEVLISAKSSLYLSYIGKSPNDQQDLNPSSILGEFIDYLVDNTTLECLAEQTDSNIIERTIKDRFILQEYLSSYNILNYVQTSYAHKLNRYGSYDQSSFVKVDNCQELRPAIGYDQYFSIDDLQESYDLDLDTLKSFFKKPYKYFLNKLLQIYPALDVQESFTDTEPFEINLFDQKLIINDLLENDKISFEQYILSKHNKAQLPFGIFENKAVEALKENYLKIKDILLIHANIDNLSSLSYSPCNRLSRVISYEQRDFSFYITGKYLNIPIAICTFAKSDFKNPNYSHVLDAVFLQIAYFMSQGALVNIKLIDFNGNCFYLEAMERQELLAFIDKLLEFYLKANLTALAICDKEILTTDNSEYLANYKGKDYQIEFNYLFDKLDKGFVNTKAYELALEFDQFVKQNIKSRLVMDI